jgi:hypothetical protein
MKKVINTEFTEVNLVASVGHNYTKDERKDDYTVIIAHRGDPLGLWATIHGCEAASASDRKYSYVIVANGMDEVPQNTYFLKEGLETEKKLGAFIHTKSPLAPPTARQLGVEQATGNVLFFFDNHCIPVDLYFERGLIHMKEYGIDLLHSTTQYWTGKYKHYHYPLTLEDNFWVTNPSETPIKDTPYYCACGGAGGFAVSKEAFDKVGGYGPIGLFEGWGGEETYLDLKMWMFGYKVGVHPNMLHWHYEAVRSYARHNTPEFYINLMTAANALGGKKWLDKVSSSFSTGGNYTDKLRDIAHSRSSKHHDWIAANAKYSLDEVLELFKRDGIAH